MKTVLYRNCIGIFDVCRFHHLIQIVLSILYLQDSNCVCY